MVNRSYLLKLSYNLFENDRVLLLTNMLLFLCFYAIIDYFLVSSRVVEYISRAVPRIGVNNSTQRCT